MLSQSAINNKFVVVEAGGTDFIKMNKASNYSAQAYSHTITIRHDNASAIPSTVTPIDFLRNALSKLTLQIGAGDDIYSLNLTAHLLRQLWTRKELIYNIDRTVGTGKVSTFELIIDFLSVGFESPKDTILFNTGSYDHLMTEIVANDGDSIADVIVHDTKVHITESYKMNSKRPLVNVGGELKPLAPQHKKPVFRQVSMSASNNSFEYDIPDGTTVSKIMLYVTDGNGKISEDHIKNVILKTAQTKYIDLDSKTLESWNRLSLKQYANSNFKGVLVLDIAQGQYTECLKVAGAFKDSKLELDFDKRAVEGTTLNMIFETVINA